MQQSGAVNLGSVVDDVSAVKATIEKLEGDAVTSWILAAGMSISTILGAVFYLAILRPLRLWVAKRNGG